MAHSIKTYAGDGATTDFLFDIPYIKEADVHGFVDNTEVEITFIDPTNVRFTVAPADLSVVQVKRKTDTIAARYTFPNKTYINSTRLDGNTTQQLYLSQEQIDETDASNDVLDVIVPEATAQAEAAAVSAAAALVSENAAHV